ncbi:MAG: metal-sensing transcriptional repressor [Bacilli bacterium]|nr:metal-sensing transcriptional repressor [Bacilli bacterium]
MEENQCPHCAHMRHNPRDEEELKSLQNRIARIQGQLSGISKMLDENRYCGDVLTQIAAVESALQSLGYIVLASHMNSCVKEDIIAGRDGVIEETVDLIKKLK